jgi:hypothetical protein
MGADTFTYKGNLYTTDLAPSTPVVSAPTFSYDAFGNAYSTPQAAAEADNTMAQQAATAQQAVEGDEESLFEQPVVSELAQEYLDSLGTDFDFGQFDVDAKDPRGDQIVSPTGTGIGQADFSYVPQANTYTESLQEIADQSAAGTIGADEASALLGLGAGQPLTDAEVAAIMAPEIDTASPTGPGTEEGYDFSGPIGTDAEGNPIYTAEEAIEVIRSGQTTNPRLGYESGQDIQQSLPDYLTGADGMSQATPAVVDRDNDGLPDKSFTDTLLDAIMLRDPITKSLTSTAAGDMAAAARGIGAFGDILGSFDMTSYEAIDPATGQRVARNISGTPRPPTTGATRFMQPAVDYFQDLSASEFAKLPPKIQEEMEASRFTGSFEDLMSGRFPTAGEATGRGIALNAVGEMGDIARDVVTSMIPGVGLPLVFATSAAEGGGSAAMEIDAKLDQLEQSGELAQNPDYQTLTGAYRDSLLTQGVDPGLAEAQAQSSAKEAIRQAASPAVLGAGLTAGTFDTILAGLASPLKGAVGRAPMAVRVPATATAGGVGEAATEGLEQLQTNLGMISGLGATDVTPGQSVGGQMVSAFLPGTSRGVTAIPSQTAPNQFVPTSQTAGQPAQAPAGVESAYEEAAKTMEEAGVRGVGDTGAAADLAPDNLTLAEQLMTQQLEDTGAIDVTELDGLGLTLNEAEAVAERAISKKMDSDNQMLQALADESVLETGGVSQELVAEINDKLGPEAGAQVVDNAVNRPFVSNEGKTRMDIMLENAKKAGQDSVTAKPATGIETALGANTGLDIKTDSGLDSEQQLDFLFDDDDSQQLNLLDTGSSVDTTEKTDVTEKTDSSVDTTEKTDSAVDTKTDAAVDTTTDTTIATTVNVPDEDDDDEVEVEVDDDTTTTTTDDDGTDIFIPVTTTTDEDGNTITECPEGYEMVETADGPMCQKITTAQRQRAGRGVQAYTGIVTRPGERGPGQRRITTTRTERVRPTTRSV